MQNPLRTFVIEGSLTAVSPLATCSKDLLDREGQKNAPTPIPTTPTERGQCLMFPATGIRGALRRRALAVVRQAVIDATGKEHPFNLDESYFLTLGGIKGSDAQNRSTVAHEAQWRIKNPLLSLFGAGDAGDLNFVQGRLGVGNAVAVNPIEAADIPMPPVIFSGARTDEFYRDKSQVRFLSDADIAALISRAKGGKDRSSLETEIKGLKREIAKAKREGKDEVVSDLSGRIAALEAEVSAVKKETGTSDNSVGMPLAGFKAIPQGCVMDHRMLLVRSNQIELGFLLKTLGAFAMDPLLGAHFATGCGLVSGKWSVDEATIEGRRTLGTVSFQPYEPLQVTGDALTEAIKAYDAFFAAGQWDFSIPKAA